MYTKYAHVNRCILLTSQLWKTNFNKVTIKQKHLKVIRMKVLKQYNSRILTTNS